MNIETARQVLSENGYLTTQDRPRAEVTPHTIGLTIFELTRRIVEQRRLIEQLKAELAAKGAKS